MTSDDRPRRRWFATTLAALALFAIFAIAFVAGAVLHLDLPAGRRLALREVNRALAGVASPRVTLGSIERLTPTEVVVRSIDVDIVGTARVHAQRVRARVDPLRTL